MKQQKKKTVISIKPEKKQEKTMVYPIYPTKQQINTTIEGWQRGGLNE